MCARRAPGIRSGSGSTRRKRTPAAREAPKPSAIGRVFDRFRLRRGVRVQGLAGLLVRYAQCCQPVPGDPVVGFVSQTGTNIKSAELSSKDGAMFGSVLVEVEHSAHLSSVMRAMRRVKGVHS